MEKKKESGSRKPVNCKSFEALFEVFCSDRESITLLNFLSLRVNLGKFSLLSGELTMTHENISTVVFSDAAELGPFRVSADKNKAGFKPEDKW